MSLNVKTINSKVHSVFEGACSARFSIVALVALLVACANNDTPAAALYLSGAEIQAETDDQRMAVRQVLNDMTTLSSELMRNARYGPELKTLPAFLRSHVVPSAPVPIEDDDFITQADNPSVRAAVEELRRKMAFADQQPVQDGAQQFNILADQWSENCKRVMFSSNIHDYLNDRSYRELVNLGASAIPYIMERYRTDNLPWEFVLDDITGLHFIKDPDNFSPEEIKKHYFHWWSMQRKKDKSRSDSE